MVVPVSTPQARIIAIAYKDILEWTVGQVCFLKMFAYIKKNRTFLFCLWYETFLVAENQ